MASDAQDVIKNLTASIKTSFSKNSTSAIQIAFDKSKGSVFLNFQSELSLIFLWFLHFRDNETKKILLDQSFREFLVKDVVDRKKDVILKNCDAIFELSILAAKADLVSKLLPIQLISDIFDMLTLEQCEALFECIERNVGLWKSADFFTPIKNNLLRLCNGKTRSKIF